MLRLLLSPFVALTPAIDAEPIGIDELARQTPRDKSADQPILRGHHARLWFPNIDFDN